MPAVKIVFYRDAQGVVPVLEWLDGLTPKVKAKCRVRIERLRALGHELRRPEADYLREGIYELRASYQGVHYRILYFFHGTVAAVLAHGVVKERRVPPHDIELALRCKQRFVQNPQRHTYEEP